MNISNKYKQIILLFGDVIVLYFSLYLTLFLRYLSAPNGQLWHNHFWLFSFVFLGWLVIFYISGLYSLHIAVNNTKFIEITWKSLTVAALLSVAIFYIIPQNNITPKTNLLIYVFVFASLFIIWRRFFNRWLYAYLPKENIAIIGYNQEVKELFSEFKQKPQLGFAIKFVVDDKESTEKIDGIEFINNISELKILIKTQKISTIVLTTDPHHSDDLRLFLFELLPLNIKYISLSNFYENITGKVPIDVINQMWFLENLNIANKKWFDFSKRIYDIILALIILLLTIIFWPIVALIIRLESKGEIFFRQVRSGKNNQPFYVYKFRTMTSLNNDYSPTAQNDKRITRFGNLLRKTRLDEVPQILNILRGEMSFVGPRPERPELITELEKQIPFYKERMLVKPGATGWDQVSGEYHSPSNEDSLKKLQYDLFYIKNRSIYLDISIILKTIATIISRQGM